MTMKIGRTRVHKIRPANYEILEVGASVEIDAQSEDYADMDLEDIRDELDTALDVLLDKDIERALDSGGTIAESHIWDFYKIEENK